MNLRLALLLLSTSLLALLPTRADIAPSTFVGSGIVPRSGSSVRMEKATVEIVWGTPCLLTATFRMVNASKDSEEIQVGFPMPYGPGGSPHKLSMSFDGQAAMVTPPDTKAKEEEGLRQWVWYHCQHKFKPGTTIVVVKSHLRASRVYATGFREELNYCIETGGNWRGDIGEEEVTIRFPHPVEKAQITNIAPAGYKIDGNCVNWRFTHFKPAGKDHDIAIEYVRPDAMKVIAELREQAARQSDSSAAAIKLAKHLLALGNIKSNSGFPPSDLSKEQYDVLLKAITAPENKNIFANHYRLTPKGRYEAATSEWTAERISLVQILADAGYRDEHSKLPFILEGESLLKDTLARDLHNAEAWNVYLASYWRFSFAAMGQSFGQTCLSAAQAKLIEQAAQNCPEDECISLWLKMRNSPPDKQDAAMSAIFDAIESHHFLTVDFPKIEYGYY